ncbi:MAG: hypothetical protein ACSNEK_01460 [Parachlamydiaceae bacterium]
MIRSLFCLVFLGIFSLHADHPFVKIPSNVPAFYQLNIQGSAKSEGRDAKINFKEYDIDAEFSATIKQENEAFAELVITPKKAQGVLKFNHETAHFDFSNEEQLFAPVLFEAFPILRYVQLNEPIKIAITNDEDFLSAPQHTYPYLPLQEPKLYAQLSSKILELVMNGSQVEQRIKSRTKMAGLGLEIFYNQKVLNQYLNGDYTFRFSKNLLSPKGCRIALMGGGKLKSNAQMANILNAKIQGVFLILFQKVDCSNKALDTRYEFRGKIRLRPKNALISYSI